MLSFLCSDRTVLMIKWDGEIHATLCYLDKNVVIVILHHKAFWVILYFFHSLGAPVRTNLDKRKGLLTPRAGVPAQNKNVTSHF